MSNVWFISDTHFFHDNILKFEGSGRDFTSADEMNEVMVQNWNKVVKPADIVHHLGDVSFKLFMAEEKIDALLGRLLGQKHLYLGNHDTLPSVLSKHFCKVRLWKNFGSHNFVACHVPLSRDQFRKVGFNVHGHTHMRILDDPCYINICVEHTNYAPVHLDEILATIKRLS